MRAVKSVSIDSERRVIITYLDGSTETLYPNCIWCDSEALRDLIKDLLEEKADAITQTIENVTVATFSDGADEGIIKKLLVSIEPIQEGSGDPSPENVRPISGRTGLNAWRTGKNLLPMPIVSGSYNYTTTITVNNDKSFTITKTSATGWVSFTLGQFTLKPGTYTLIESADGNANTQLVLDKVIGGTTEVLVTTRYNKRSVFTVEADTLIQARYLRSAIADNVLTKLMLFIGNAATATDYEAYKGNTYSVNWETEAGTVYGGTLDVVSGKLVVDRAKITLDGTHTVANVVGKDGFTNCRISGFTPVARNYTTPATCPKAVCSDAKLIAADYAWQNQDISSANLFTVNGSFIGMSIPGSFADANAIKAYLTSHNVDVCYEIATPTEIQLTPQEVRTLLGDNNIWSDSGNILELEYTADTKLYISEQQSGTSGALGSARQEIVKPDVQTVSEKTLEDVEAYKEDADERGEK